MLRKLAAGAAMFWLRKPENRAKATSAGKSLFERITGSADNSRSRSRRLRRRSR